MEKKELCISVDPRIELLMISQILTNYNNYLPPYFGKVMYEEKTKYFERMENHFHRYRSKSLDLKIKELTQTLQFVRRIRE